MSLPSLLDQYFNEEELRTLCFHLDVTYDNLGARGKAANARELVELLQRQNRLPALLNLVRRPACRAHHRLGRNYPAGSGHDR